MSIHATSTEVYSGIQLLTGNGYATASSDTSYWNLTANTTNENLGNAWGRWTNTQNTQWVNMFSYMATGLSGGAYEPDTKYTVLVEWANAQNVSRIDISQETASVNAFVGGNKFITGVDSSPSGSQKFVLTTKSTITQGMYALRTFITKTTAANTSKIDLRVTIAEGDYSSVDFEWQPYVGGVPSPLISGVAHVSTSKNLLNMQSGSNGEYLGTTSQQTYSGKNLYNQTTAQDVAFNVTYSGNSMYFELNGNPSSASERIWIGTSTLPAGTYTLTLDYLSGSGNINVYGYSGTSWTQAFSGRLDAGSSSPKATKTFTLTQETNVRLAVYTYSGNNYSNLRGRFQIETGSTATAFEPYVGGIPSPNLDYPQEIVTGKIAGKNLLDLSTFVKGRVDNGVIGYANDTTSFSYTDDSITYTTVANYRGVVSDFIPVKPNTPYISSAGSYGSSGMYRDYYDSSKNWISRSTDNPQVTPSNCAYMRVSLQYSSVGTTTVSRPMLEEGSTATTFEPYFTPIELAQIGNYQDRLYKSGNDWVLNKVVNGLKLGTNTGFSLYTGVSDTGFTFFRADIATPLDRQCVSNYFDTIYAGWDNLQSQHIEMAQVYTNNALYLKLKTSRISSLANLNTWLSNRDVRLYYILNTPTTTTITDQATIDWLNKYDTNTMPHHKYINTRRTTYVGASGLASAIDLYDGSYASTLPTYTTANDHHLTTANGGTYTVSLQNISASIVSGAVTFSVFTNQRKIDFSWNGSATSTNVSVSLQADEYIKSIYAYIPQDADAGITLSQQLESGSLTDFEPYYNIAKIYAGNDLVFEDTSLTD